MLTTAESTRILHPARIFTAGPRGPLTAVGLRFTFIFPLPFSLLDLISRTSSSSIRAYSLVFLMHPSVAPGRREMGFFFFSDHLGTWLIKYHTSQVLTLWLRNASLSQLMKNHLSRSFAFLLICLKNIEILLCGTISVFFFFFCYLKSFIWSIMLFEALALIFLPCKFHHQRSHPALVRLHVLSCSCLEPSL